MTRFLRFLLPLWLSATVLTAEDYLRLEAGADGVEHLQVAVRDFRVAEPDGVVLRLVGVSHLGTADYFAEVQDILNAADVVLYEGVDGDREEFRNMKPEEEGVGRANLQVNMARALGLEFQLHEIDYNRPHFINSDLSGIELVALFSGDDADDLDEAGRRKLEALLASMEEQSLGGRMTAAMLGLLERHPEWGRAVKWGMVRIMGNLKGDLSGYAGLPEDMRQLMNVLIRKRNDVVMEDIREQLPRLESGDVLAVFYGAAHMADFEERLVRGMAAEVGGTRWLTAFSGDLDRSGLNSLQKGMVSWVVEQQVRTLSMMTGPEEEEDGVEIEADSESAP